MTCSVLRCKVTGALGTGSACGDTGGGSSSTAGGRSVPLDAGPALSWAAVGWGLMGGRGRELRGWVAQARLDITDKAMAGAETVVFPFDISIIKEAVVPDAICQIGKKVLSPTQMHSRDSCGHSICETKRKAKPELGGKLWVGGFGVSRVGLQWGRARWGRGLVAGVRGWLAVRGGCCWGVGGGLRVGWLWGCGAAAVGVGGWALVGAGLFVGDGLQWVGGCVFGLMLWGR